MDQPEILRLAANGWMPNNDHLAVLLYRRVVSGEGNAAAEALENLFQRNSWSPRWRNGVYPFHHYHSTAHEVLGFAEGTAILILGGENGHEVKVSAGDVAVLPVGTGHCRLKASPDFLVVGGYPPGQSADLCRQEATPEMLRQMAQLPLPPSDPVQGNNGPLVSIWRPGEA